MQLLADEPIISLAAAHPSGAGMFSFDPLAGNIHTRVDQLIDRHQFLRSDVDGTRKARVQHAYRTSTHLSMEK
jgi:hypothetical protein